MTRRACIGGIAASGGLMCGRDCTGRGWCGRGGRRAERRRGGGGAGGRFRGGWRGIGPGGWRRSGGAWYGAGGLAVVEGRHAGGRGAPSLLTPVQKEELAAGVATGRFRTAAEIRRWVAERWGVRYTEGGMYALLGRLRCAPKVPRPVHAKADHLAQARWKKG